MSKHSTCWCVLLVKVPNVYMVSVLGESGETRLCGGAQLATILFAVFIMLESFVKYPRQLYVTLTLQVKSLILP